VFMYIDYKRTVNVMKYVAKQQCF